MARIRDLRWKHNKLEDENAEWWESDLFDFSVQPMRGGFTAWQYKEQLGDFDTKEGAMAWCQRKFEREVKRCLIEL